MKRIISVMLAAMLLLTANVCVGAEENESKVNFSLQCNGKNTVTVKAGTEIQVDLLLKNEDPYKVFTLTDEVDYDESFFDYVGEITSKTDKVDGEKQTYTDGVSVIKIMGSYTTPKTYEAEQHVISFKLKVKDTATGYGMVKSDPDTVMVCGSSNYEVKNTDLTVIIGDDEDDKRVLTFDTNGGTMETTTVVKSKGETVDLSEYTPSKSGYKFKGWYSDSSLSKSVTKVTLRENTTVYAKWEKESTGGGGGGGGTVTAYKLTFDTNGGTEIKAISKTKNSTVDLSQYTTEKEDCVFEGWYTDEELTQKVTSIKITADTTVYAKWSDKENDNSGSTNGGSGKPDMLTDEHYAYIVGREDGGFYPHDNLTRAEAATMIYRLLDEDVRNEAVTEENGFEDVTGDNWFNTSVSTLAKLEIINGKSDTEFAPLDNITRAEFTAIMARFSKAEYSGEDLFDDISKHWAKEYINIAAAIDWVQGDNGLFRPNDSITRAEVVTLINRALNRQPESKDDLLDGMITPPDNTDENAWYYLAVQEAVNSHDYELKADEVHEKWTSLNENPDW